MAVNIMPEEVNQESSNEIEITCPECKTTRTINVAKYRSSRRRIKAKCGCGCIFDMSDISADMRKFYRKKANLRGSYSNINMNKTGFMRVKDVSYTGISFELEKKDDLIAGDTLGVRFVLDDERKTEIHRAVVVKNVRGKLIGVEFCDNQVFDIELCYYIALS
ncbi:MAG: PilZ domain-containing protein [bacterium]|nr:PilZ domain-containing protein [bacterium]